MRRQFDGGMHPPYWDEDLGAWVRSLDYKPPVDKHGRTMADIYDFVLLAWDGERWSKEHWHRLFDQTPDPWGGCRK